ncbi:hypothetical protein [Kordia sp.]|uniref:hypothetical protein n=1 Tax=Kordia sp. TaxID=1965332 RepID=UPI003B5B07F0
MLKKISNLKGVKGLSKTQQSEIQGGRIDPNVLMVCNHYATAMALADGEAGGYLDDEVTMSTLYNEHFYECSGVTLA